jgi:hypothetical protein
MVLLIEATCSLLRSSTAILNGFPLDSTKNRLVFVASS